LETDKKGRFHSDTYTIKETESKSVLAYPNPVAKGSMLTIKGVTEGSAIQVFNQAGVCVIHTIVAGDPVTVSLDVPVGFYVLRTTNGEFKLVVQ